ncbi:MAG: transcription-repair coupling factor [Anaerolineales bacterium]|jgi:transcription-repair coupling factor (superfamily II helicase)
MKHLLDVIHSLPSFQHLLTRVNNKETSLKLGLNRAVRLPILISIFQAIQRPILFVTQKTDRALILTDELSLWSPETSLLFFPEPTSLFYENVSWGENTRRERIQTLTSLATTQIPGAPKPDMPSIVIAPARAIMARTIPRREFIRSSKTIKQGQNFQLPELTSVWVMQGYQPVSTVVVPGQFARRGGILDIWPPSDKYPTRLEFFGNEIDSLRYFNPSSQRTIEKHDLLFIPPSREFIPSFEKDLLIEGQEWTEFYIPLLHEETSSILNYLPKDALVLFDDMDAFIDTIDEFEEQSLILRKDMLEENALPEDYPLPYLTLGDILDIVSQFQSLDLGSFVYSNETEIPLAFSPNQRFGGQVKLLVEYIQKMFSRGDEITIVSRQAARLQDVWQESLQDLDESSPKFIEGSLSEGWLLSPLDSPRQHLLTDGEIFGWKRPQPRQRPRAQTDPPESGYLEFQINELVVHIDHGIGRYKGLVTRKIESSENEYICIEYSEGDQLFVPIHQADRVTRYIGSTGHRPSISRLSSIGWKRIKARVKKAIEAVAEDLLELYAKRKVAEGFAFSSDSPWQKELEASFPYIETEDQLRVLEEVKSDMEIPRPMDRLICGDVGYGKTEVALRATFKAVMDGKQVAMLVPTTILAQQHYRTFRQRLAPFPVEVEMLSRFRTHSEQQAILNRLLHGTLDIVIGTHRLIQKDVNFKDLGLVIIDEEQRFGVTHKEFLTSLRTEVDVLTMTATPIPRTLYMALTGVRDISTINTPPEERLPIVTHVGPYEVKLVRQAILRELERGGQVFFVHNRVQTIEGMRNQVHRIVPEARIAIAHGQMAEKALAKRMRQFTNGEIDVLISTSIIESGLDIPNANTLIVDRADTFGLAQLYQLRGRVGRGAQRAYAYFFKHRTRPISDEGRMRLETIAENTQLGAGFSIAMRDLEIRGAGDFLGTRQHGHIAAVGLNLYTKLLSQAVAKIKLSSNLSEDIVPTTIVTYHPIVNVDLPLLVSIPQTYIPDKDIRLRLYRRLADLHTQEEIDSIKGEFVDRFGPLPEPVANLFYQLEIRSLAENAGISSISSENNQMSIRFPSLQKDSSPRRFPILGKEVRTGKNTLWFQMNVDNGWKIQLKEILVRLATANLTSSKK